MENEQMKAVLNEVLEKPVRTKSFTKGNAGGSSAVKSFTAKRRDLHKVQV